MNAVVALSPLKVFTTTSVFTLALPPPPPPEIVIVLVPPVPLAATPEPTKLSVVAAVESELPSS